jgi:hypothetical protein
VAYFLSRKKWCFQPHIHHDLHHVYHAKTPRYATTISQKPLQNTTTTTPEKNPGYNTEKAVLPDGLPARAAVTS